jgi:hypothetical protein
MSLQIANYIEFYEILEKLFKFKIDDKNSQNEAIVSFKIENKIQEICKIRHELIQSLIDSFIKDSLYNSQEECELYSKRYYEAIVGVNDDSETMRGATRHENLTYSHYENKKRYDSTYRIEYNLGIPSYEFLIFLIDKLNRKYSNYKGQLDRIDMPPFSLPSVE